MTSVVINPLSAARQFFDNADVCRAIEEVVGCFKYLHPGIEHGTVELFYDLNMERRGLMVGSATITADVNSMPKGDAQRLWFVYAKNRSKKFKGDVENVTLKSGQHEIAGEIYKDTALAAAEWLSLAGTSLGEQPKLSVIIERTGQRRDVNNSHQLAQFRSRVPFYKENPKHGKKAYKMKGVDVSPMPLDAILAQKLLLASVEIKKSRWTLFKGNFYCFRKTHIDQNIFHGYLVSNVQYTVQERVRPMKEEF